MVPRDEGTSTDLVKSLSQERQRFPMNEPLNHGQQVGKPEFVHVTEQPTGADLPEVCNSTGRILGSYKLRSCSEGD